MASPEENFHRAFLDMERTGTLAVVLAYVQHRSQVAEADLRTFLRETPLVGPTEYARAQLLQGKLAAFADLHRNIRTLGTRVAPRGGPNGHDDDPAA